MYSTDLTGIPGAAIAIVYSPALSILISAIIVAVLTACIPGTKADALVQKRYFSPTGELRIMVAMICGGFALFLAVVAANTYDIVQVALAALANSVTVVALLSIRRRFHANRAQ